MTITHKRTWCINLVKYLGPSYITKLLGHKYNIQKPRSRHLVPSLFATSRKIEGEQVEAMTGFIFSGSKITVDGDGSHEIERCLLLGRKAITNLETAY